MNSYWLKGDENKSFDELRQTSISRWRVDVSLLLTRTFRVNWVLKLPILSSKSTQRAIFFWLVSYCMQFVARSPSILPSVSRYYPRSNSFHASPFHLLSITRNMSASNSNRTVISTEGAPKAIGPYRYFHLKDMYAGILRRLIFSNYI